MFHSQNSPDLTRLSGCLRTARLLFPAVLLVPAMALAHGGADGGLHHGFVAGLLHPFTGLDHLLAMLAVGLWAGQATRRTWAAPLAFVNLMLVGALLQLPAALSGAVEPMVAASLVVLGLLLLRRVRWPALAMGGLAGGFALFHGAAHAVELSGGAALAGMLCGTLLLQGAGLAMGRWTASRQGPWALQATGGAVASVGALLLVTGWL
jgi:urease accessory protein